MKQKKNYGTVPLVNEAGQEIEFEVLEILHHEDKVYYVLYSEEEDPENVVILEVVCDDDDEDAEIFLPVEDENLLQKLFRMYMRKCGE